MPTQDKTVARFGASEQYRVLTRAETARALNVSVPSLERWARRGIGPRPLKIGPRRVGYRASDLAAFLDARAHDAA